MASFKLPAWGSDYYTVFLSQAPNSCNLSIVPIMFLPGLLDYILSHVSCNQYFIVFFNIISTYCLVDDLNLKSM